MDKVSFSTRNSRIQTKCVCHLSFKTKFSKGTWSMPLCKVSNYFFFLSLSMQIKKHWKQLFPSFRLKGFTKEIKLDKIVKIYWVCIQAQKQRMDDYEIYSSLDRTGIEKQKE